MIKSESKSRRVKITKRMIEEALVELLEEKNLSEISVTELCKSADINRSTFYCYYEDLSDVLEEIEQNIIDQIPLAKDPTLITSVPLDDFEKLFGFVRQHARVFNILLEIGNLSFKEALMKAILKKYPLPKTEESQKIHFGYVYALNGVLGMAQEWIRTNFPMSDLDFAKFALSMSIMANKF